MMTLIPALFDYSLLVPSIKQQGGKFLTGATIPYDRYW